MENLGSTSPLRQSSISSRSNFRFTNEELLKGEKEWRNIQPIIRNTFNALCEELQTKDKIIKQLSERLDQLENELSTTRDTLNEFVTALRQEMSKLPTTLLVKQLIDSSVASLKTDQKNIISDIQTLGQEIAKRPPTQLVKKLIETSITPLPTRHELEEVDNRVNKLIGELDKKANKATVKEALTKRMVSIKNLKTLCDKHCGLADIEKQLKMTPTKQDLMDLLKVKAGNLDNKNILAKKFTR